MREFLKEQNADVDEIWDKIKDIVIKTIISMESTVTAAYEMFASYPNS